jgi:hypothetical protein
MTWIRTCQECGHRQSDKQPDQTKELTSSFCSRPCNRCKSEGLDYGSWMEVLGYAQGEPIIKLSTDDTQD